MNKSQIFGLMLIVLAVIALITIPYMISISENTDRENQFIQDEGTNIPVHGYIESSVLEIRNEDIDIQIIDTNTQEVSGILTINESESEEINFEGGDIFVTVDIIDQPRDQTTLTLAYNQQYGWTQGEIWLFQLIRVLIAIMLLVLVYMTFIAVMDGE